MRKPLEIYYSAEDKEIILKKYRVNEED